MDPKASRETLDHSIMYIFAVALEDADWHHVKSYTKARANQEEALLRFGVLLKPMKIKNGQYKYHDPNPKNKSFGAKITVTLS